MPKVVIAGASGFLGTHLCRSLKLSGNEVVALERHKDFLENTDRIARWDGQTVDRWIEELETADVLINLSGKNIAVKWKEDNRKAIRESRIGTTQLLAEACRLISVPPRVWLNMSGINYYRQNLEEPLDESGPTGTGFLAELVRDWEAALFEPEIPGMVRIALRTAPVLGHGGGAFEVFEKVVKWFIGGQAGSGKQWVSWIHVEDWVRLAEWAVGGSRVEGQGTKEEGPRDQGNEGEEQNRDPGTGSAGFSRRNSETSPHSISIYNACSPEPLRNKGFMAELRRANGRPWAPPAPTFAIKLVGMLGGPDPSLALEGFRILPKRALDEGFEFRFPNLKQALSDIIRAK